MDAKQSLQFSLWDHTLAALLKLFAEQKSSRFEVLKGWSWLLLSMAAAMVPREVVSSDRPRGGAPPQRIRVSVVGDDPPWGRVCEPDGCSRANSDRSPTRPHSLTKWTGH